MAIPTYLLSQVCVQRRKTDVLAYLEAPFDETYTWTGSQPILLEFCFLDTASGTLTIAVTGKLNGVSQTEAVSLPYPGSGVVRTSKRWTEVTRLQSSGTSTGTLRVRMAYTNGESAITEALVDETLKGYLREASRPVLRDGADGLTLAVNTIFYTNTSDLLPDDLLEIDGVIYRVEDRFFKYTPTGRHHVEAVLKRMRVASTSGSSVVWTPPPSGSSGSRRYHKVPTGSRPGVVFLLPDTPLTGTDRAFLNNQPLRRLSGGTPGVGEYVIVGATITLGQTLTVDDYLEFDYDV